MPWRGKRSAKTSVIQGERKEPTNKNQASVLELGLK